MDKRDNIGSIKVINIDHETKEEILFKLASIAHICYAKDPIVPMRNDLSRNYDKQLSLVLNILKSGHHSILEHVTFTFGIEGISRNCTHQIVRHRNTAYAQQSFHYTIAESLEIPELPIEDEQTKGHVKSVVSEIHTLYKQMIAMGIPREEARHILPSGQLTRIFMTANLRQWIHFIEQRTCVRNCKEIYIVAELIKRQIESKLPFMKDFLGPTCTTQGVCKEIEKCGKVL